MVSGILQAVGHGAGRALRAVHAQLTRASTRFLDQPERAASVAQFHRVGPGESIADIASKYGVSTASLLLHNGLRWRSTLVAGQIITITTGPAGCRSRKRDEPTELHYRVVRENERLTDIARELRVCTRILLRANGFSGESSLYPGLRLVVPTSTNPSDTGEVPSVGAVAEFRQSRLEASR